MMNCVYSLCIINADEKKFYQIQPYLKDKFTFFRTNNINEIIQCIRKNNVDCVITYVDGELTTSPKRMAGLKSHFPLIPLVAVFEDYKSKAVQQFMKIGADYLLEEIHLQILIDIIYMLKEKYIPQFDWHKLNIDLYQCPPLLKEALVILKQKFVEISNIKEFSKLVNIPELILSQQLVENVGLSFQKLLKILKIWYALILLKNPGYYLDEVAALSGFSDIIQFEKSFKEIIGDNLLKFLLEGECIDVNKLLNGRQK